MASYNTPQTVGQYVTQLMGYTGGKFGGGEAVAFRNKFTPEQQKQWQTMVDQLGGNVPLSQAQLNFNSGVVPVGQIEPFNQYQRDALTQMAQPNTAGNALFGQAQGAVDASRQQLTPEVFDQMIQQYMNPFTQQVIDSSVGRINDAAGQARARLAASQAGRRSFGDSSSALQSSQLDKNVMQQIADTASNLNYQGFGQAAQMGQNQFNTQRQMDLAGAGMYNQLGQGAYGRRQQDLASMFGAGSAIQQQNQNLLDVARGQIAGKTAFPYTQVSQLGSLLGMIPNSQGEVYNQTPNSLSTLGGLGMALGGGISSYQNLMGDINSTIASRPDIF